MFSFNDNIRSIGYLLNICPFVLQVYFTVQAFRLQEADVLLTGPAAHAAVQLGRTVAQDIFDSVNHYNSLVDCDILQCVPFLQDTRFIGTFCIHPPYSIRSH